MFLAPSHERIETIAGGKKSIQIYDGTEGQGHRARSGCENGYGHQPQEPPVGESFWQDVPRLSGACCRRQTVAESAKSERLGVEKIDGRRAEGFHIQLGRRRSQDLGRPENLAAHPRRRNYQGRRRPRSPHRDVRLPIGVDLDESLFSVDLPAGYTVQQTMQIDLSKKPVAYLAEALKWAAEHNDGVFPAALRGEEGVGRCHAAGRQEMAKKLANNKAEMTKLVSDIAMKTGWRLRVLVCSATRRLALRRQRCQAQRAEPAHFLVQTQDGRQMHGDLRRLEHQRGSGERGAEGAQVEGKL